MREHALLQPVPHPGGLPGTEPSPGGVPGTDPSWDCRSCQRHPVLSTNKMPSSAARSSIGGRPSGPRAGGRGGSSGSSSSHNRSSTNRCFLGVATISD
jgi:hypothetical protein